MKKENTMTLIRDEGGEEGGKLIEHVEIEGTPFTITGSEEKGWFLRMGNYKLTEMMDDKEKIKEHIDKNGWLLTVDVIAVILDAEEKMRNRSKSMNGDDN